MRVSVRKNDPGFNKKAFGSKAYLNGEFVSDCFTADEETGEVFFFLRNEKGELYVDETGEEVAHGMKTGNVKIVLGKGE